MSEFGYAEGGTVSETYIDDGESGSICPIPRAKVIFDGRKIMLDEEVAASVAEFIRQLSGQEG